MLIEEQSQMDMVYEKLRAAKVLIAIDTETTMTNLYEDRICMGISLKTETDTFYIPTTAVSSFLGSHEAILVGAHLLDDVGAPVVSHNIKFDFHVLKKLGIHIPANLNFYDTMLMAHLIDENRVEGKYGTYELQSLAKDYLGDRKEIELSKAMKDSWNEMPAYIMAKYAEQDAQLHYDLYMTLKPKFVQYEETWKIDRQLLLLLQEVEERGLKINTSKAKEIERDCYTRVLSIQQEIGIDPGKTTQLHPRLFSDPPVGIGLKVTHRTPGGKPQVNDKFLEQCNHPIAGLLLEWRKLNKQITSYYRPYVVLAGTSGRLHANFNQHRTTTGRLSCNDPNLTQLPREGLVKGLFLPDEGKELWEIDYRGIELRLAAVYSQEAVLLEIFEAEGDMHQYTADKIKISRHAGKTLNFSMIYGGGVRTLVRQLNIGEAEARRILDDFHVLYPRLFQTSQEASEACARNNGAIKMWSGRYRHFRHASEYYKAFNAIIQGGSFEIVKRSCLALRNDGYDIRNIVHDSVWLSIDRGRIQTVNEAQEVMSDWTRQAFGLNFSTEAKRLA